MFRVPGFGFWRKYGRYLGAFGIVFRLYLLHFDAAAAAHAYGMQLACLQLGLAPGEPEDAGTPHATFLVPGGRKRGRRGWRRGGQPTLRPTMPF